MRKGYKTFLEDKNLEDSTLDISGGSSTIIFTGAGQQTIFAHNCSLTISQSGRGKQTIVADQNPNTFLNIQGGLGSQTVWTGAATTQIATGDGSYPDDFMHIYSQTGSTNQITLRGERTIIDCQDGVTKVMDSGNSLNDRLNVFGGTLSLNGGKGTQLVDIKKEAAAGTVNIETGSGAQNIFIASDSMAVNISGGSTAAQAGSQMIVGTPEAKSNSAAIKVTGGKAEQTIWTGAKDFSIIDDAASSGKQDIFVQGGTTVYQNYSGNGVANINNMGGDLEAFLSDQAQTVIHADMLAATRTELYGLSNGLDSIYLDRVGSISAVNTISSGADTEISVAGQNGHLTLHGVSNVSFAAGPSGIQVFF